jgi:hypothetical protein
MSEFDDIEAARAEYAQVKPLYEKLAQAVRHILETPASHENVLDRRRAVGVRFSGG